MKKFENYVSNLKMLQRAENVSFQDNAKSENKLCIWKMR